MRGRCQLTKMMILIGVDLSPTSWPNISKCMGLDLKEVPRIKLTNSAKTVGYTP